LGLLFMWQLAVHAFRNWPKASDFNDRLKRISLLALYFYLFTYECESRFRFGSGVREFLIKMFGRQF